ncbi:MAG: cbb3-type cytochrome oxidase assembly protein CcoS [Gammaproteobacteria bacterium]|nr:cbb3-type cytochrome oxidase assembly protein CcoS [Gammaproteobacteria bacterium]
MDVIWLLIPLSMVLVLLALRAFVWAVRTRQFDDLDREAARILFEDPKREARPEDMRSGEQRHD